MGYQFNEGTEWGFVLCNKIVRLIRYMVAGIFINTITMVQWMLIDSMCLKPSNPIHKFTQESLEKVLMDDSPKLAGLLSKRIKCVSWKHCISKMK